MRALGDIRLEAVYSGFSNDMSSGAIFGVKLPTGDFHYPGFDRDTEIGSGATEALLGAYHSGSLGEAWTWFGQIVWSRPLASQGGYTPGAEFNGALGVSYTGYFVNADTQIVPTLQMLGSNRIRDGGPEADAANSGYDRLLLSPGIEVAFDAWKFYGDVEFPVYQEVNGNQLVAHQLFKFVASYSMAS